MKIELENNLNNSLNVEKRNNFFNSIFGQALNEAINYGLKKIFPDFLEDEIIEIKDTLINNGIKDGLDKCIDAVLDIGKSITGIFTGEFKKVSELELAVGKGGILSEISNLLNKSLDNVKEKEILNNDIVKIIKGGSDIIEKSLEENISNILKEQKSLLNSIDYYIEKWRGYKTEKDFEKMEKEYLKIKDRVENLIPLEETNLKIKEIENLYNLIKNNGKNFNISNTDFELVRIL